MKEFAHPDTEDASTIDINRSVSSTVSVARNEWRYVAEVETKLQNDLPLVYGRPGAFNQVILNMIVNAAHAIEELVGDSPKEKGTISLTTVKDGDWVEIRVKDTGAGISEQNHSRIFDPFFTTKQLGKGTGHGLAVAHAVIIEDHKGSIDIETAPGRGTTFVIRLPIENPKA
jgi:signal transduction histidine kinase